MKRFAHAVGGPIFKTSPARRARPSNPPKPAAQMRPASAEDARHREAAGNREVAPESGLRRANRQLRPGTEAHRPPRRQRGSTNGGFETRPGDRHQRRLGKPEARTRARDLQRCRTLGVPREEIREPKRPRINRAPRSHADTLPPRPAEVLDGRHHAGLEHVDPAHEDREAPYSSEVIGRKRTRSPTCRSEGVWDHALNRRHGVHPMRFQPPGVSNG